MILAAPATRVYPGAYTLRVKYEGGAVEFDLLTQTGRPAVKNFTANYFAL